MHVVGQPCYPLGVSIIITARVNAIFTTIFGINALRSGNCVLAAHLASLVCMHGCILTWTYFHACVHTEVTCLHVERNFLVGTIFTYRRLSSRKSMNKHYFQW